MSSRRKSLFEDKEAQNKLTEGLENIGMDHELFEKVKTGTVKIRKKTSTHRIQLDNTTSTPMTFSQMKHKSKPAPRQRHPAPHTANERELKRQVHEVIKDLDKEERSKFQGVSGAEAFIKTPDFQRGLDKYFDVIDAQNSERRECANHLMCTFGIVVTLFIVTFLLFVNHQYQDTDQVVGFVTTTVHGVGTARSPLMAPSAALVYDGRDVVVPSKEMNAIFLTTKSYQLGQNHGTCVGLDKCTCPTPDQLCPKSCPAGQVGNSGVFTGRCIRLSTEGITPEDRRCEVSAWCPVLDVKRAEQSKIVAPALTVEGVDTFQLQMTVNSHFPKFAQSTQYNVTASVKDILRATQYSNWNDLILRGEGVGDNDEALYKSASRSGAMLFIQFTYDCDIDRVHSEKCEPTMTVERLLDDSETLGEGDAAATGYGFKTVEYFTTGTANEKSRRVRHLKGLRIIFDVAGRARKFNFGVMMTTVVSGFGFAALAFIVVNEGRLLCESNRAHPKTSKEIELEEKRKARERMASGDSL